MRGAGVNEVSREAEEWLGAIGRVVKHHESDPSPAGLRGLLGMIVVVANSIERARTVEDRRVSRTEALSTELLSLVSA